MISDGRQTGFGKASERADPVRKSTMPEPRGVQVVENWADLVGKVLAVEGEQAGGFVPIQVKVLGTKPVPGYPNLFEWATGQTVSLEVPIARYREIGLTPGTEISCRARLAAP